MSRGCDGLPTLKTEIEGQLLTRCPKRLFLDHPDDMSEVLWYYSNYKRGLLPVAGGLLDQPALLMEMFKVIDSAMNAIEIERSKEGRGGSKPKPKTTPRKGTRERPTGPVKARR